MQDYLHLIDFAALENALNQFYSECNFAPWLHTLKAQCAECLNSARYGDLPEWQQSLTNINQLKKPAGSDVLSADQVVLGGDNLAAEDKILLKKYLLELSPWRKGGFMARGVHIDAEWRSDKKWQRLAQLDLRSRRILDVGCGNGYYALRMLGAGANHIIGIDPNPRFIVQFAALKSLMAKTCQAQILPLGIEQLPADMAWFDMVFSMGVFYHRRSPIDHLIELKNKLQRGGQLLLETLIIDGDEQSVLVPKDRYAMMRNVWFIPSIPALTLWLKRAGFGNIQVLDVSQTDLSEQRRTEFMQFQSLGDFLDPNDRSKTIEGYSAPKRAMLLADFG